MSASPKRPPRSLAFRLGWQLAAVMLLAILLTAAATAWRAVATVHDIDDAALQSQAKMVAARLPAALDADGGLALPEDLTAPFRASDGDNVFLVYDGDRLVGSSDPVAAAKIGALLGHPLPAGFFRVRSIAGHEHGMFGLLTQIGRWRVVVLQGREQTAVLLDSLIGKFLLAAVWLLLPIGATMVLVGVFTLRHGLLPVRRVSAAAASIGPARPGARLPTEALPGEIAPLVHAVNDALTRLEQALLAQRRFVAEAAHALRTPLAVLTARLDTLEAHPDVGALRRDADRMGRLVGQLLRMARLEGLPLDISQSVNLHAVAVEVISALVPLALQRQVEIALDEQPNANWVRGNHAALVLAVSNLVENAVSHAPTGTTVTVAIAAPATVTVLDCGPGVMAKDRERIFGRFERGSAPSHGGAGLGLAIVAEIAAAHGGTVRALERESGGAAFVLNIDCCCEAADTRPGFPIWLNRAPPK